MKRNRFRIAVAVAMVGGAVAAALAWATPAQISTGPYQIPVTAEFESFPKICNNTTSIIDVSGTLTFPGVAVDVKFQNQDSNPDSPGSVKHTKEVATTASMNIYDLAVDSIPKQQKQGGAGGNPWIFVILKDSSGNYISDPIAVGRCVVGNSYRSGKYTSFVDADAAALLTSLGCDQKGSFVDLGTDAGHEGVDADVIFSNNKKFTHATDPIDARVGWDLTPDIHEHKGGNVSGGKVTGNPIISARFTDHNHVPLQDYITLGRCNQIGA